MFKLVYVYVCINRKKGNKTYLIIVEVEKIKGKIDHPGKYSFILIIFFRINIRDTFSQG